MFLVVIDLYLCMNKSTCNHVSLLETDSMHVTVSCPQSLIPYLSSATGFLNLEKKKIKLHVCGSHFLGQAAAIRFEFRGGEWENAYMQMDGEPWKQPLNKDFSTFLEIRRVPFQPVMIHGDLD